MKWNDHKTREQLISERDNYRKNRNRYKALYQDRNKAPKRLKSISFVIADVLFFILILRNVFDILKGCQ